MSFGGVDVSALLASMLTIQGLFYLFDYLYRIFQTVRLVSKFWDRGVVHLPEADIRSGKAAFDWSVLNYVSYSLQILPFVWLQLLMTVFFFVFIAWSAAGWCLAPPYHCSA